MGRESVREGRRRRRSMPVRVPAPLPLVVDMPLYIEHILAPSTPAGPRRQPQTRARRMGQPHLTGQSHLEILRGSASARPHPVPRPDSSPLSRGEVGRGVPCGNAAAPRKRRHRLRPDRGAGQPPSRPPPFQGGGVKQGEEVKTDSQVRLPCVGPGAGPFRTWPDNPGPCRTIPDRNGPIRVGMGRESVREGRRRRRSMPVRVPAPLPLVVDMPLYIEHIPTLSTPAARPPPSRGEG